MLATEETSSIQSIGTFFEPLYWLPIAIGVIGVVLGIIIPFIRSTKPRSHASKSIERYFDYEKSELVVVEDYYAENMDNRFYKKMSLFKTNLDDRYEVWGYENGIFEKKILPYLIDDSKKANYREIKIRGLSTIVSKNINGFKVIRYVKAPNLKDNIRKRSHGDRILLTNENGVEIRNYIFPLDDSEVSLLKGKSEIEYIFPKENRSWAVIKKIPEKIGEEDGQLEILF